MLKQFVAMCLLLVFTPFTYADVESGPKAGEAVKELKVFAVLGPVENQKYSGRILARGMFDSRWQLK